MPFPVRKRIFAYFHKTFYAAPTAFSGKVLFFLNQSVSLNRVLLSEQFTFTSPPFDETTILPFIGSKPAFRLIGDNRRHVNFVRINGDAIDKRLRGKNIERVFSVFLTSTATAYADNFRLNNRK